MKFKVITLFPDLVKSLKNYSVIGRAIKNRKIKIDLINLRDFGIGRHSQVDDKPYGGGAGMLLRVDVIERAIKSAIKKKNKKKRVILLSPEGKKFSQKKAREYADFEELILICGHYEGFDERVKNYVDEVISVGDFVLSGGEIPAMTIIDAISRLVPNVINPDSLESESFTCEDFVDYPQYTRPEEFKGEKVPDILLSGNHQKIKEWRNKKRAR